MPEAPESESVEAKIIRVIAQTQRIPASSISIENTFEQLNIDSLDGINIVFALENEFGIEIPDEGANTMRSLREIANGVNHLLAEKSKTASSGGA